MTNRPDSRTPMIAVMTSRDVRRIYEVCLAAGAGTPRCLPQGVREPDDLASLMSSGAAFFLAFIDGEPVGALGYRWERGTLRVMHVAVKASHQGCGVGRRLMQAVESVGFALGTRTVTLEVGVDSALRRTFERYGYSAGSERNRMSKALTGRAG